MRNTFLIGALLLTGGTCAAQEVTPEQQARQRDLSNAEYYTGTDLRPLEKSLSSIGGTFKSFYDLIVGLPGSCMSAYQWCVDSFLWCIYAVVFAYGQRLYMLWFGVWRPRS